MRFLSFLLATVFFAATTYAQPYTEYLGARVSPQTAQEVQEVLSSARTVLSDRIGYGGEPVDVVISPEQLRALQRRGIESEIIIADVQTAINAEQAEIERRAALGVPWHENYHRLDEINDYLYGLVADYPDLAVPEVVGRSWEGRDILAVSITGPGDTSERPQVVLNGAQHAREWITSAVLVFIVENLLSQYDQDERITSLLDRVELVLIPVVNPDGYEYSWTDDRLWRKNRRVNGDGSFGVDLNRNWTYAWGGTGSSGDPDSSVYRGPAPLSEPESSAVASYIESLARAAAHIDFHSYGQLVLYPWTHTCSTVPEEDLSAFVRLAEEMADAIWSVHGMYYEPKQGCRLYIHSGTMLDWGYAAGLWSISIELRPAKGVPGEFELPPDQIIPTAQENLEAVLVLAELVAPHAPPPPEFLPEDYNQDGAVDREDLNAYFTDWTARDPRADWDGDGLVTLRDLLAFARDWREAAFRSTGLTPSSPTPPTPAPGPSAPPAR